MTAYLAFDLSGSMSGEKLEMAKEAARATSEVLEPSDLIGVVAFDNQPITVVRLQKASNRMRISTDIALAPFAHPIRLAEDLAILDQLSGGRMEIGLGLGYAPHEFREGVASGLSSAAYG